VTTRVSIDPNVRVRANGTYAGLEDVSGPLAVGDAVEVYELEANIVGSGRVTEIDLEKQLVYLSVDWASLREAEPREGVDSGTDLVVAFPDRVFAWTAQVQLAMPGGEVALTTGLNLLAGWDVRQPGVYRASAEDFVRSPTQLIEPKVVATR